MLGPGVTSTSGLVCCRWVCLVFPCWLLQDTCVSPRSLPPLGIAHRDLQQRSLHVPKRGSFAPRHPELPVNRAPYGE